jgi:hypothetical protein
VDTGGELDDGIKKNSLLIIPIPIHFGTHFCLVIHFVFSVYIRKLAKNAYDILKSLRKVAKILNVKSHTTISRWLNNPEHKPYTFKNKQPSKSEYIVDILKLTIEANPFITPIEFST